MNSSSQGDRRSKERKQEGGRLTAFLLKSLMRLPRTAPHALPMLSRRSSASWTLMAGPVRPLMLEGAAASASARACWRASLRCCVLERMGPAGEASTSGVVGAAAAGVAAGGEDDMGGMIGGGSAARDGKGSLEASAGRGRPSAADERKPRRMDSRATWCYVARPLLYKGRIRETHGKGAGRSKRRRRSSVSSQKRGIKGGEGLLV